MDTRYLPEDDPLWHELYTGAEKFVQQAQKTSEADFQSKGVPPECAARLTLSWWDRGRNTFTKERAEMRKVAYARIDELEKRAKVQIEQASLEIQTKLATLALESSEARAFLDNMPSVETLMPTIELSGLEKKLLTTASEDWDQ